MIVTLNGCTNFTVATNDYKYSEAYLGQEKNELLHCEDGILRAHI